MYEANYVGYTLSRNKLLLQKNVNGHRKGLHMKKFKRIIGGLTTACIVGSLLAGCGSNGNENAVGPSNAEHSDVQEADTSSQDMAAQDASQSNHEDADPFGPVSEPVTLHVGRGDSSSTTYPDGQTSTDNFYIDFFEETLNVNYEFDFAVDGSNYETKVSMAIASGDMPDVMVVTEAQLRQLVNAGAVEDLTDAYEKYVSDGLRESYETVREQTLGSASFNGRLMAMPGISAGSDGIPMLFIRGDWMEELGLEAPESLEDIINIAQTFKEKNPGGRVTDGILADSTVVSAGGNNSYGVDALFALYHSYPKFWTTDETGELVYGSITEETKTALSEIRKLMESGIIDASFTVRDDEICNEMVSSGQAGVFFGAWWNLSWPLLNITQTEPEVYWNVYLAPLTEDGKYNTHMISPTNSYVVLKAGATEAMKEAVIKTINWINYNNEGPERVIRQWAGLSDEVSVAWNMAPFTMLVSRYNDKEVKAQQVMDVVNGVKGLDEIGEEAADWYNSYKLVEENGLAEAVGDNRANGWAYTISSYLIQSSENIINKVYGATYAKTDTMNRKWATLEKLEDETFLQILSGEADIDAFDDFVEKWKSLGGDEITAELKEYVQD